MNQPTNLEINFHDAMVQIYLREKAECGLNAARFLQMVANEGGLSTSKKLLAAAQPAEGFAALWEMKRLDLTVEFLVLRPEYKSLFNAQELATARNRLIEYGYPESDL